MGEDDAVARVNDDGLDSGRARVDAEPAAPLGLVEAGLGDDVEAVAGHELVAVFGGGEEGVHARGFNLDGGGGEALHERREPLSARVNGGGAGLLGLALPLGGLLVGQQGGIRGFR